MSEPKRRSGDWEIGRLTQSPNLPISRSPNLRRWLLVAVLLLAAAIRFVGLDNSSSPPGLEHDEVAHWLINQDILAGEHGVYFTEAYGHEALYHYFQAYFGALVGDHALALRLPSAYLGVLLVAVSYALGRRLFGPWVGLWSAAFLAVLFWPVFYSRLALRAIALPVLAGMAAVAWWRAEGRDWEIGRLRDWRLETGESRARDLSIPSVQSPNLLFLISGVMAGLSLHTYMAARAVPIFFGLYCVYLALFHRAFLRRHWRGVALFWLAFLVVAAPLVWFLLTTPGAEVRIAEVDAPLRAALRGDVRPALENVVRIAGMFGFRGDPLWRQNVAGRPVFDPVMAALFYLSVGMFLWHWRDRRHAFVLLWLSAAALPSVFTIDAPSSIRLIMLLPALMLFPLELIHTTLDLSTVREKFSTELVTRGVNLLLGVLLLLTGWRTVEGLWRVWPANDEVRFVWQAALTEAAAWLDRSDAAGPVAVGGWTPDTMDAPTMGLNLRRDDLSVRFFDPTQSVILPFTTDEPIRIVTPTALPLAPLLAAMFTPWEQPHGEFTAYEIPARPDIGPQIAADAEFGGQVRLLGYDVVEGCMVGEPCTLLTYWQTAAPNGQPRRIFLHAVDEAGQIVAQDDRLGAPAEFWQPGDLIMQLLTLTETTEELRLGIYDPANGQRLMVDGEEFWRFETGD